MDIEKIRAGIPALKEAVFFNAGGMGPIPAVVADEMMEMFRVQVEKGRYRADVQAMLEEKGEEARRIAARFFGVTPEEIMFPQSVSDGLNTIAEGVEWKAGDEVIVSDHEHPSGYLPWLLRAEQQGVVLKRLSLLPDPEGIVDRLRALLTDRTRVVVMSHVTSALGIKVPAEEIVRAGHGVGALVGFDAAQSAGQFPVNVREMGCDFYAATSFKWCLGPYGIGSLYVKRETLPQLVVRRSGAKAVKRYNSDTGEYAFFDSAMKFEFGARSLPLRIGYGRALRYIEEIGTDRIEAQVKETAVYFREAVGQIPGARVQTPEGFCAGAINVVFEGADPGKLCERLWEPHRIVAVSPAGGIRFSLAFFTTREEIDRALEVVKESVR